MKLTIPNPFVRHVNVYYWHAEAFAKKKQKGYMDRRFVYYDGPTSDDAVRGLRAIILLQSYTATRFMPVVEKHVLYPIPIWSLAYWIPRLRPKYMEQKGFFRADRQ